MRRERADDRAFGWDRSHDGRGVFAPDIGDRDHLAGAGRGRRCRTGTSIVRPCRLQQGAGPSRAGLAARPCGAASPRRDPGPPLGGVPRRSCGRLRLQPVLRSVHRVAPGRQRDDAPDPCRRREAVRRLRRRHRAGVRCRERRRTAGPRLRRGAGRLQLHLCGSALERRACRLDRCPRERAGVSRWRAEACWFATTCGPGSPPPAATSPASIAPTRRWRHITAPPCCRPGFGGRATRFHEDWLQRPARVQAGD